VRFEPRNEEDDSNELNESKEEVEKLTTVIRRSEREIKPSKIYSPPDFCYAFVLISINDEPKSVDDAIKLIEGKLWKEAMVEEMESLYKNETWDLVKLLSRRKLVGSKWVFKKKMNSVGKIDKFKAQMVAKGYSQVEGVEFGDMFSPVAKITSIRVLMSLAATFNLEIEQIVVKTMFLHGDLEEEIYMKQRKGFVVKGKQYLV
jgi:hypothetical protein